MKAKNFMNKLKNKFIEKISNSKVGNSAYEYKLNKEGFVRECIRTDIEGKRIAGYYRTDLIQTPCAKVTFDRDRELTFIPSMFRFLIYFILIGIVVTTILPMAWVFSLKIVEKMFGVGNSITLMGTELDMFGCKLLALGSELRDGVYKF